MNKEKSLEERLDKIVKSRLRPKKSTKELIDEAFLSPNLSSYFNQLPNNQIHKQLLFLHRFDLFGFEDELQIPYIHLCNLSTKSQNKITGGESRALPYFVSEELQVVDKGKNIIHLMFGIDENQWETMSEDFKDVLAYFIIFFIRSNQNIKKLIQAKSFDYKKMKDVLKDYQDTIDFEAFSKEVEKAFQTGKGNIDPIIRSKAESLFIQFVTGIIKNMEGFIENVPKIMPNYILSFHLSSTYWLKNLLIKSGLTFKDFIDLLDELHRNYLIEKKSTIFWCESCNLEYPSYTQHQGRIAPSKTCRSKCLNCNKPQSHASIYSLEPILRESIFSKDGLLSIYFGWLLKKHNLEFEVGGFSDKYENDFIIRNSIIVEGKMFKTDKDLDAIRSEMINSFFQIEKHIKQLESEGFRINQAYLLWNRDNHYEKIQKKLKTKHKELFNKYGFKIICPYEMEMIIEEMK
jgi:hypothetical protein